MNRTQRAFERRFRELLGAIGARDREKGVQWIRARADVRQRESGITPSQALTEQNILLARRVHRFQERQGQIPPAECRLICDAGLGGLARWLRAAGCDAHWIQDISDGELVRRAEELRATIITTDSLLLERRPITSGLVPAIWVPPSLSILEQLRLVESELTLPENDSRCMRCGGELLEVNKESVKDRIPPRTYAWVDEYFECTRCHQLFWHGTHWTKISDRLSDRESNSKAPLP